MTIKGKGSQLTKQLPEEPNRYSLFKMAYLDWLYFCAGIDLLEDAIALVFIKVL